jgi:hypothetical protein
VALREKVLLWVVVVAITVGLGAAPALAATRVVGDPRGDANPRYDMVRVRFVNGDTRLAMHIRTTPGLRRGRGYADFHFSPNHGFTYYFEAVSRRTANGAVHNKLTMYTAQGHKTLDCRIEARWAYAAHTVSIELPRSCASRDISGRLYMTADLGPSAEPMTQDFINYQKWPRVPQG